MLQLGVLVQGQSKQSLSENGKVERTWVLDDSVEVIDPGTALLSVFLLDDTNLVFLDLL